MRLTDLRPSWWEIMPLANGIHTGLTYDCIKDQARKKRHHVEFSPPISLYGELPPALLNEIARRRGEAPVWARTAGDTFDTLSLTPSIAWPCGCHFTVTKGELL